MGSDFTFDDLGDRKINADVHTLLRKETVNEKECYRQIDSGNNKTDCQPKIKKQQTGLLARGVLAGEKIHV